MGELRQKFNEDMQLHGLAPSTRESYTGVLLQASRHFWRSPADITKEQWRDYFLFIVKEQNASPSKVTQLLCALKFLYRFTLEKELPALDVVKPKKRKRLPKVLAAQDIKDIIKYVRNETYSIALTLIYACGLRLNECLDLRIMDTDFDRTTVHVIGKGNKDRYISIPRKIIHLLKRQTKGRRPQDILFRNKNNRKIHESAIQRAFKMSLLESGIGKPATIHTLRHSYATHLLEAGVSLPVIQKNLGHSSIKTTMIYLHVARTNLANSADCINRLL
ncbi:MAG: hypothetical protein DSY80_03640 [Desulfocapsa sp.]|nr:MAG: hypothetical protein DSY80_03640 [Desulfocapsa sp.]